MRVAFLTQDLQLSGGVGVVVEHAHRLADSHGFDVTLVLTRDRREPDWRFRDLERLHVVPLEEAARHRYDVAVSTWWQTARDLFELRADRHACFVQSLEERFYAPDAPERLAAALSLALPARHLTEARWIADALHALHPGARPLLVRNGVDKDVFAPPAALSPALDGPLRIVVEGSRAIAFKGVDDALAATAAMREERHVTLVTPDGSGSGAAGADVIAGPLSHAEMAQVYAGAHVVLKLSRVEGMAGPPLEGFHRGATTVTTPVTGHEEYVRHGHNGLVVDWDDPPGAARALDLLAHDRALLHRLRTNALATARAWPSWDRQAAVMAAALRAIQREPPPPAAGAGRRLARDLDAATAHAERLVVAREAAVERAETIRTFRTYQLALRVRDALEPVLRPLRWARRLRRR